MPNWVCPTLYMCLCTTKLVIKLVLYMTGFASSTNNCCLNYITKHLNDGIMTRCFSLKMSTHIPEMMLDVVPIMVQFS